MFYHQNISQVTPLHTIPMSYVGLYCIIISMSTNVTVPLRITVFQFTVGFDMMTSSNGNIFRVTGPLCGEITGHRLIPRTNASDAEL